MQIDLGNRAEKGGARVRDIYNVRIGYLKNFVHFRC